MNRNQVFALTRLRLAGLYTGTMGLILLACSVAFYQATAHNHGHLLNRKLASVAGTLHDGIEPALESPGQVEPIVDHFLPGLVCLSNTGCPEQIDLERSHIAGVIGQDDAYVHFLDMQGNLVAIAGQQSPQITVPFPPDGLQGDLWDTLTGPDGTRYRQLTLSLKTRHQIPWGYIQVGLSLQEHDEYLAWLGWTMLLGLPSSLLLVALASWWLAGFAMRPVYQSYQQIQQFTADAAHELRTPIAAIQAATEFTLEEPAISDSEARQTLDTIARQNSRLSQLVQDLLLLSRVDVQGLAMKPLLCSLNELMTDLIESFSALAHSANIQLKANIRTTDPVYVLGDEEKLYRLFANLIANALQYTPPGGTVTVSLDRDALNHAIVQVQDTGIGIGSGEQARIFERFYRVSRDRARHTGGVGLGLAIVQALVQAHQGSIHVQSELGKGSLFTVRLPIEPREGSKRY